MNRLIKNLLGTSISLTSLSIGASTYSKNHDIQEYHQNNHGFLQSIFWNYSAEKKALFLSQYQSAKLQFDAVVRANKKYLATNVVQFDEGNNYQLKFQTRNLAPNTFIPVVVVDLDGTFLDNTPLKIYDYFNTPKFNSADSWKHWILNQHKFNDQIYPGVLNFVKYVWGSGGMVFFNSQRWTGDHHILNDMTVATRKTLINNGYPKAFLDSYVWWMGGISKYDHPNWKLLKSKEDRLNYLNDPEILLRTRTMQEFNIADGWKDIGPKVTDLPIHIVMRIGDDINDFNDNLTTYTQENILQLRNDYLANKNIQNLFGQPAREIWFSRDPEDGTLIQNYWKNEYDEKIDQSLFQKGHVVGIKEHEGIPWKTTYLQIGGNALYGSWLYAFEKTHGSTISDLESVLKTKYLTQYYPILR